VAHEVIKEHAVAVALEMRERAEPVNHLLDRLATDPRLGLRGDEILELVGEPLSFVGTARPQVAAFAETVKALEARFPDAFAYRPEPIL
jgi:adenylosuccinate lyase